DPFLGAAGLEPRHRCRSCRGPDHRSAGLRPDRLRAELAAGHPARQRRDRRRGDRSGDGRLYDADRPDELAVRGDGDHRLLCAVRIDRDRVGHPGHRVGGEI
ncbi:MAG: Major pilus subunit of type IV secretion complex, VirB2, partial [uncultured Sphingomonas sp.]